MNVPITQTELERLRRDLADMRGYRSDSDLADLDLTLQDKKTISQAEAIVSAFAAMLGQLNHGAETFQQLGTHFDLAINYYAEEAK